MARRKIRSRQHKKSDVGNYEPNKEAKPEIKVEELTEEERQAFIDASLPVRDRIEEFGGKEAKKVLDLLLADVEKYEKER